MIGRNDPCWCGSGKKYKKCHLQSDSAKIDKPAMHAYKNKMIKTPEEIAGMRRAGVFNGELLDYVRPM